MCTQEVGRHLQKPVCAVVFLLDLVFARSAEPRKTGSGAMGTVAVFGSPWRRVAMSLALSLCWSRFFLIGAVDGLNVFRACSCEFWYCAFRLVVF